MSEHEQRKDLNLIVTHVDDSSRGREGQYVYLWGKYVKSTVCASNIWTLFLLPTFSVLKRQKRVALKHRFQPYFLC